MSNVHKFTGLSRSNYNISLSYDGRSFLNDMKSVASKYKSINIEKTQADSFTNKSYLIYYPRLHISKYKEVTSKGNKTNVLN